MSKEQNETIDLLEKILTRSEKEVERIHRYYRLAAVLLSIIIGVGIYFSYSSISDFKSEMRNDVSSFKETLKGQSKGFADSLKLETNNKVALVQKAIVEKVDEEFDKENISALVENKASDRVDLVADRLIKGQIDSRVDSKIRISEEQLNKLINKTQFQLLELQALNDDRSSFDSLIAISKSNSSFAKMAKQSVDNIILEYENPSFAIGGSLGSGYSNKKIQELKTLIHKISTSERVGMIWDIWDASAISLNDRIELFIDIVKSDQSLKVVSCAAEKIIELRKLPFKKLEIEKLLSWWQQEKKN